jgi:SAM-dependent methyltransferase
MLKPDRNLQQEYAFRPLGWDVSAKQSATPSPTATAGARGKAPKTKAGKTQPDNSTPFVYGPEETVAYCNFFFPSRFAITQRIFRELKMLMPKYQPRRILDLGCGVGTVGACAVNVWGSSGPGVQKYVGIDQSAAMLDAAKIMTKQMGVLQNREDEYGAAASAKVKQYTPSSSTRGKRSSPEVTLRHQVRPIDVVLHTKTAECVKRIQRGGDKERFDMAAVAYTLSELQVGYPIALI